MTNYKIGVINSSVVISPEELNKVISKHLKIDIERELISIRSDIKIINYNLKLLHSYINEIRRILK